MPNKAKGWINIEPKTLKQRKKMYKKCKKCFLGKNMSFPICKKNSCKINKKGLYAAYIRAAQFHHRTIKNKAKRLLKSYGIL